MIKTISHYKSVLPFSKAPNAFLVIAKAHKYKLNTALFKKQRTGYWKIKNGRVNPGDALFLVMEPEPLVRELFGGIVKAVLLQENGTKIIQVDKFIELGSIDGNFSDFFGTRATSPNSLTSAGYLSDWGTGNNRFPLETESEYGQSPIDIDYGESYQLRSILTRRGQPAFRRRLLTAYSSKCAVTGCSAVEVLEAAHIQPHAEETDYDVTNGLLLRSDVHVLFDLGLLAIGKGFKVLISSKLKGTEFAKLAGSSLLLPENPTHYPNTERLAARLKLFKK